MEHDIIALGFDQTHIFQPSMLLGNRKENRPIEQIFTVINPLFIGKLSKYKGISGKSVAMAMNKAENNQSEKVKIYQWKEMNNLLNS